MVESDQAVPVWLNGLNRGGEHTIPKGQLHAGACLTPCLLYTSLLASVVGRAGKAGLCVADLRQSSHPFQVEALTEGSAGCHAAFYQTDVYKRQQVDGRFASQPPGVCVKATPVSYTHLDVYKRQRPRGRPDAWRAAPQRRPAQGCFPD